MSLSVGNPLGLVREKVGNGKTHLILNSVLLVLRGQMQSQYPPETMVINPAPKV